MLMLPLRVTLKRLHARSLPENWKRGTRFHDCQFLLDRTYVRLACLSFQFEQASKRTRRHHLHSPQFSPGGAHVLPHSSISTSAEQQQRGQVLLLQCSAVTMAASNGAGGSSSCINIGPVAGGRNGSHTQAEPPRAAGRDPMKKALDLVMAIAEEDEYVTRLKCVTKFFEFYKQEIERANRVVETAVNLVEGMSESWESKKKDLDAQMEELRVEMTRVRQLLTDRGEVACPVCDGTGGITRAVWRTALVGANFAVVGPAEAVSMMSDDEEGESGSSGHGSSSEDTS